MDLVAGAMGRLVPKLLQLLGEEYKLQTGVKKEVKSLSVELESIYSALRKVAQVPWDQLDEQVKLWASEIRESSYDMEDLLDTFLVRLDGRETTDASMLKRAMNRTANHLSKAKARHDIAGAVEDIKKQLQEVAERRARYRVDEIVARYGFDTVPRSVATSIIDPRLPALYKEVTQLVGIDKAMDDIITMLSSSPNNMIMKMVSIVGVGGLGKTTLAKASYDKLSSEYHCTAFTSVGRGPDLAKVFKDILFDLDKREYQNIHNTGRGVDLLIRELREFLKNKRYFIVIDDIWELQSWEIIKLAFVDNNCGSGIISTTRKFEVANEADEVYKLEPLSYLESKKLLYAMIFKGEDKCFDNQVDEVSNKILKKCGGIPLAIITMSSLLVDKPKEEWQDICSAIGFRHRDNINVDNTMRILSFSYYDLPSHLKTCLLYISAFPEDCVISKVSLIWMWIAEGFVHAKQEKWLFHVGEEYFNDLINRSMTQVVKSENDCTVEGCRVHDMVLDLIRSLSREGNFVTIIRDETSSSQSCVRRLALQNIAIENLITPEADQMDVPQVRSYIAWGKDMSQWDALWSFKFLRVLAIKDCQVLGDLHLENLGNLVHLRYLGLSGTKAIQLPKQIGDLKFLQTIDVRGSYIRLPASVVQLSQLVCLRANAYFTHVGYVARVPDGIGKLTSLEELRMSCDDKSNLSFLMKELGSMCQLRVLESHFHYISMDSSAQKDFMESLRNLHKIQHISLSCFEKTEYHRQTWEVDGFFELPQHLRHLSWKGLLFPMLPSFMNPSRLHNLSFLELTVQTVDEQGLMLLGRFPDLRVLVLTTYCTTTLSIVNANDGYFQKLKHLVMQNSMVQFQSNEDSSVSFHIWNGEDATPFGSGKNVCRSCVSSSAVMPNLEVLQISVFVQVFENGNMHCGNIGLEYLTSLQMIKVYDVGSGTKKHIVKASLRNEIEVHPNRPKLRIKK